MGMIQTQRNNLIAGAGVGLVIAALGTWKFQGSLNPVLTIAGGVLGAAAGVGISVGFLGGQI